MKNAEESNKGKIPGVTINPELNKYDGQILFPKKLEIAEKQLKGVKVPPIKNKQ